MHFVSWRTMCKPKDKGGYGVQSLVEKLGPLRSKHALNFIMKPNTLLNRVLRARYVNVLWNGVYCSSCTSSWKIIQNGADFLLSVLRWNISNGEYVDTFKDIWILDKSLDRWPTFVSIIESEFNQVSDFITNGSWDIGKLKICFGKLLIGLILSIPIYSDQFEDKM
ncbi:putative mitochondrial protein [Dendrobium catenatum]|uniref:Putative mitochondrial protein n=1 Tax=Dendrobium catenatum TaxID=906689 RepID=A0A2I0XB86_9ASPA|nr:putative mitochondrial protein [Dendrobium catenatum]